LIIEIKGVQFANKGAELMLESIVEMLNNELESKYTLALSPRNSPYKKRSKFAAYQKIGNLYKRIDWSLVDFLIPEFVCKNYGLVKHNDIDVVLDASGFSYGQQWNSAMLRHSVRQAKKMYARGGKYIFLPQAMGPFEDTQYRRLIVDAVKYSTLMFVRDKISYRYVTDIAGKQDKIKIFPDFTNVFNVNDIALNNVTKSSIATIIPNNKMMSGQNKKHRENISYIEELTDTALYLQKIGYHVCILNHEGALDLKLCQQIFSQLDPSMAALASDLSSIDVKRFIGESKLVVSSRFHGCVSALSQGIPVIGTSWSHKYEMLYDDYGVSSLLYQFDSPLSEFTSAVLARYDDIRQGISKRAADEKKKSIEMWASVIAEVKG
jgi:polysaccharide pyruvyl transferase WcaK-like protein